MMSAQSTLGIKNVMTAPRHVFYLLEELAATESSWEIRLCGLGRDGVISIADGRIAWVRVEGYPESLSDVLMRDLRISPSELNEAMHHCAQNGEKLRDRLLHHHKVRVEQLRAAMINHIVSQLQFLLSGDFRLVLSLRHTGAEHDDSLTFDFDTVRSYVIDGVAH